MKNTRRLLLWLCALGAIGVMLVGAAGRVLAQTENTIAGFQNVRLWVNPEYDDPRLLVMLEGEITGATPPVPVRFLVPSAAEMYSAGSKDASGKYTGGPPDRRASDIPGWDEISYTLTTPIFRVEYYDPGITGDTTKTVAYQFRTLYPIARLQVYVQEPRGASNFAVTPQGQPSTDSEGFNIQLYNYPTIDPATPLDFSISYTKSGISPSLPSPGASGGGGVNNGSDVLGISGIAIAIAAILGAIFYVRKSRQPRKRAQPRRVAQAKPAPPAVKAASKPAGSRRFCRECGQPLKSDNNFCPYCGAEQ